MCWQKQSLVPIFGFVLPKVKSITLLRRKLTQTGIMLFIGQPPRSQGYRFFLFISRHKTCEGIFSKFLEMITLVEFRDKKVVLEEKQSNVLT